MARKRTSTAKRHRDHARRLRQEDKARRRAERKAARDAPPANPGVEADPHVENAENADEIEEVEITEGVEGADGEGADGASTAQDIYYTTKEVAAFQNER